MVLPSTSDTTVKHAIKLIQAIAGLFVEIAKSGIALSRSIVRIRSLRIAMSLREILWGRITHVKEMINPELAHQMKLVERPKAFSNIM